MIVVLAKHFINHLTEYVVLEFFENNTNIIHVTSQKYVFNIFQITLIRFYNLCIHIG